ncbi:MAG: flagellar basal body P-ring protein FlgI, partial [Thermoguttaceae bacterium]
MKTSLAARYAVTILVLASCMSATSASATTLLKDICRVKGQEENTLHGFGLVVGLRGTGDGQFLPSMNALAKIMTVTGEPLGSGGLTELKDSKNVALVAITATIPEAGSRQGDKLDCVVSSIGSAKDLTGGRLFHTAMMGPDKSDPTLYAFAEGPITIEDETVTTGRIHNGCRLEVDLINAFTLDGIVTLVLDKNHAGFSVAQFVAEKINTMRDAQHGGREVAKALDQTNIEVEIPPAYRE